MAKPRKLDIDGIPTCKNGHRVESSNAYSYIQPKNGNTYLKCRKCTIEYARRNPPLTPTRVHIEYEITSQILAAHKILLSEHDVPSLRAEVINIRLSTIIHKAFRYRRITPVIRAIDATA